MVTKVGEFMKSGNIYASNITDILFSRYKRRYFTSNKEQN